MNEEQVINRVKQNPNLKQEKRKEKSLGYGGRSLGRVGM